MMNNICKCGRDIPKRYNSTIQNKLCPKCTLLELHSKPPMSTETGVESKNRGKANIYSSGKKNAVKSRKTKALDLADLWFSRYIRVKHGIVVDGEIYSKDIITGKLYRANSIDTGHYHSRYFNSTRFNPDNARPQNRSSNRFRGEADKPKFEQNLIREIGEERFQQLRDKSKNNGKYGEIELQEIAKKYRMLTKSLLKEKEAKGWW
jgi:hypothetical protein